MRTCPHSQPRIQLASTGRVPIDELHRLGDVVRGIPLFQATIDAMPEIVLILNGSRQMVGCNQAACDFLDTTRAHMLGKRPGELFGCVNAEEGPDGCGTAEGCMTCGAVNAILTSQRDRCQVAEECRILLDSRRAGGAMDLQVTATAFSTDSDTYTICFIKDISRRKRLEVLTRMFFHDVLNTSGSIRGFAEMLAEGVSAKGGDSADLARLTMLASQLVEEIQAQRDLVYAESGELVTRCEPLQTGPFLEDLRALYSMHGVAVNRVIELSDVWDGLINTDRRLLTRVLGNMLKNALEATDPGGTVRVRCVEAGDKVAFQFWNPSVMPSEVQQQVFQRSFSTKGEAGRGIGTHSMKLLGESYLGGRVSFVSSEPKGTVFTLELPRTRAKVSAEGIVPASSSAQTLHGRVLLAEDGPDNQRIIGALLRKVGLEVDVAENGRIACEKAMTSKSQGASYDAILMDVQMPEMDGRAAAKRLRECGWNGPVIALTALATQEDHRKCLAAGCNDCIVKPVDRATLVSTVARHLSPTGGRI
jgi:CheY-like chemotaxis protein